MTMTYIFVCILLCIHFMACYVCGSGLFLVTDGGKSIRVVEIKNKNTFKINNINLANMRIIDQTGRLLPLNASTSESGLFEILERLSNFKGGKFPPQSIYMDGSKQFLVDINSFGTKNSAIVKTYAVPVDSTIISNTAAYIIVALVSVCSLFFLFVLISMCISSIRSSGGIVNPIAHMDDTTYQGDQEDEPTQS